MAVGVGTAVVPSVLATVVAVDILEVLRDVLGLEVVLRDSRVDSVRWGGGAAYDRSREELRREVEGLARLVVS